MLSLWAQRRSKKRSILEKHEHTSLVFLQFKDQTKQVAFSIYSSLFNPNIQNHWNWNPKLWSAVWYLVTKRSQSLLPVFLFIALRGRVSPSNSSQTGSIPSNVHQSFSSKFAMPHQSSFQGQPWRRYQRNWWGCYFWHDGLLLGGGFGSRQNLNWQRKWHALQPLSNEWLACLCDSCLLFVVGPYEAAAW